MDLKSGRLNKADRLITAWMADNGILLLRISLGVIFIWFGVLKFIPGLSSAEDIAGKTMEKLSLGLIPADTALILLAAWETLIGIGLISGKFLRETLLLLFVQMLGTITPLFLFPSDTFRYAPLVPSLEGQYIIKNLILISAGIVIGATVRGGRLTAEQEKLNNK